MSWSFRYMGKVEAVKRDVEKYDCHLDAQEHEAMLATKAAIQKHLEILPPNVGVDVWGSGSMWKSTTGGSVSAEMKINTVVLSE